MRARSFSQWLYRQQNRKDYLGILGHAASHDLDWRRVFDCYHAFRRELDNVDNSNITEDAISGAFEDYERWLRAAPELR